MLEKFPLPTDSLYKFVALTGLILFILPFVLIIQVNKSTNDTVLRSVFEVDSLSRVPQVTGRDSVQILVLKRVRELAISDRKSAVYAGGVVSGIGVLLMLYGFGEWKRLIQGHADQIAILEVKLKQTQLDQERCELEILRRQMASGESPPPDGASN